MTPEPSALEAVGLSKAYGDRHALCGLDMTVAAGEFVVLLGPNGAGKTTLFQLLTGLFAVDAGRVVNRGRRPARRSRPRAGGHGHRLPAAGHWTST